MTVQRYPCSCEKRPRRTILLVEDEPFVRDATSHILQSAGFEVFPAADALEAMHVYDQIGRKADLLMTDVVLPGRSGHQLGQDLRSLSPAIAILLTSGYGEAGSDLESPDPRTYYLAKPYTRKSLVEKIEQILVAAPYRRAATQSG
jgi:two-component system, cell cycle sensor histidine kinase and response regulator CckA